MSTQVQRRRGTTAEHAAFTGALAELTIDTTKNTAVIHDGVTAGGHPLSKAAELTAHLTDAADAHAGTAITNTPAGSIAATTVQAAINELDGDITAHVGDATAAHAASAIANTPAGTIAATDVQAAINELDGDIVAHLGDAIDAHDASAISVVDTGGFFTGTDVEAVLQELGSSTINYFTEARNTAAPNATVPVHSFTALGAETNIDAAYAPKGTGALTAHIADSAATGGNKRGTNAVDLQTNRGAAAQVASGVSSVVSGGASNTASGTYSTVAGGTGGTSSGNYSSVVGGNGNTSSGLYSVSGGSGNTASGDYSTAVGGASATTRGLYGRYSYASGAFSVAGDAQMGTHIQRLTTTDATASILTADGSATPSTTNTSVLPDNHAVTAEAYVTARDTATGDTASFRVVAAVKRGAGAATTALVAAASSTTIAADAGAATWAATIVANTTRGSIEIQVTGEAATTIHWVGKLSTVEVG